MSENEEFITESTLGTKEYWENFYRSELDNYQDCGDTGETWFGKRNAHKIIEWIKTNTGNNAFICDIGCGNGYILSKLARLNYEKLYGIDYSEKAIEFCKQMYSQDSIYQNISFKVVDILLEENIFNLKMDVLIDKGTYDAICLMPNSDIQKNRQLYKKFLFNNLKSDGFFILMSCNFTKEELFKFLLHDNEFEFVHEFETPSLTFGGHVGKQVTGIVLKNTV